MPVNDPSAGRAFVWLVASLLFVCVAAGGGCLVMYVVLPDSDTSSWLPLAGVTLVCLPWLFWFLTFLYRIISRVCGFRGGNTGAANSGNNNVNVEADDDDDENTCGGGGHHPHHQPPLGSSGNARDQVQFGAAAVTMMDQDAHHDHRKHSRSSSNSSNVSHESEMPLALSMAS